MSNNPVTQAHCQVLMGAVRSLVTRDLGPLEKIIQTMKYFQYSNISD